MTDSINVVSLVLSYFSFVLIFSKGLKLYLLQINIYNFYTFLYIYPLSYLNRFTFTLFELRKLLIFKIDKILFIK